MKKIILLHFILSGFCNLTTAQETFTVTFPGHPLKNIPKTDTSNKKITASKENPKRPEKKVFFQHSLGAHVLALGNSPRINFRGLSDVGFGLYYAPKIAFRINKLNSANLGTNIQFFINPDSGLPIILPLTVGYTFGAGATKDNDADLGIFFNAGLGKCLFFSTDPDDELNFITGPVFDFGVRIKAFELRLLILKAFKNTTDNFALSLGVGFTL